MSLSYRCIFGSAPLLFAAELWNLRMSYGKRSTIQRLKYPCLLAALRGFTPFLTPALQDLGIAPHAASRSYSPIDGSEHGTTQKLRQWSHYKQLACLPPAWDVNASFKAIPVPISVDVSSPSVFSTCQLWFSFCLVTPRSHPPSSELLDRSRRRQPACLAVHPSYALCHKRGCPSAGGSGKPVRCRHRRSHLRPNGWRGGSCAM